MVPRVTLPDLSALRLAARPQRQYDIVLRPQLDAHLAMLARFAALCRQHACD